MDSSGQQHSFMAFCGDVGGVLGYSDSTLANTQSIRSVLFLSEDQTINHYWIYALVTEIVNHCVIPVHLLPKILLEMHPLNLFRSISISDFCNASTFPRGC